MDPLVSHEISFVKFLFGVMTIGVFILSILSNAFKKRLPKLLTDMYNYGKFSDEKPYSFILMVPKSWFKHFYVVGLICTGMVLMIMLNVCYFGKQPPDVFLSFLNAVASTKRKSSGSAASSALGISLMFAHCTARFMETHFISVFSESKMNFAHYACGMLHYVGASVAIAAESRGFVGIEPCSLSLDELTVFDYCAVLIFCLASYEQIQSSIILANLRKNKKGALKTYKHSIPRGRFFEVLSSPHMVAEIVIYTSLTVILRWNYTWWYIFMWVLTNQCAVCWTTHTWYLENFPSYPKHRKALIPYLF